MAYPRPLVLTALLLTPLACGDKSSGDDAADTGQTGTTTAAASTGSGDPTTDTPTDTPTGDPSTGSATTGATTTSAADTSTGGPVDSSSSGGATTGGLSCTLEQAACSLAASNGEYEDCGTVDPWDSDTAAWQAARDCALKAASEQRAFKVITRLQGIDSDIGRAYASILGRSYGISEFTYDSDPCGGGGCGPVVSAASCADLSATANCTVAPGEACLTCTDHGPSGQVCGPE